MKKQVSKNNNRVFLGGLPKHLTLFELKYYFSKFGSIKEANIPKIYNRAKGYAILTFFSPTVALSILNNSPFKIKGKLVYAREALSKRKIKKVRQAIGLQKILVKGLPNNITESQIYNFFSNCGKVYRVVMIKNQHQSPLSSLCYIFMQYQDDYEKLLSQKHYYYKHFGISLKSTEYQNEIQQNKNKIQKNLEQFEIYGYQNYHTTFIDTDTKSIMLKHKHLSKSNIDFKKHQYIFGALLQRHCRLSTQDNILNTGMFSMRVQDGKLSVMFLKENKALMFQHAPLNLYFKIQNQNLYSFTKMTFVSTQFGSIIFQGTKNISTES